MKKTVEIKKWPLKEMVIFFLATSKVWGWIEKIVDFIGNDYDNTWWLILERILTRELWVFVAVVVYFAMEKFKINEFLKSVIIYFILLSGIHFLTWGLNREIIFDLNFVVSFTVIYVLAMIVIHIKDHLKEKKK